MSSRRAVVFVLGLISLALWAPEGRAQTPSGGQVQGPGGDLTEPNAWYPSLTYQGTAGLIEMPSARFLEDGNFALSASGKQPDQRAAFTFQVTPWLEGSFRYAHINGFLEGQPNFYDRSFGLKVRLITESRYRPAVAVGINDLIGTGVYGGEYVVASKRLGNVDATVGMGWGRYGGSATINNPLARLSDRFSTRQSRGLEDTGQFDVGSFFSGEDMGFFGGLEYSPPLKLLDGLKLQLEYSSDAYTAERAAPLVQYDVRSPVNVGLTYEPFDGLEIGTHYLYGNTLGFRFAFKADPRQRVRLPRFDDPPPDFVVRPADARRTATDETRVERFASQTVYTSPPRAHHDPLRAPARLSDDQPGSLVVSREHAPDRLRLPLARLCLERAKGNPGCADLPQRLADRDPVPEPAEPLQTVPPTTLPEAQFETIRREAGRLYLSVQGIDRRGSVLRVWFHNRRYDRQAEALGRMVRVLTAYGPEDVQVYELVMVSGRLPVTMATVPRGELERILLAGGSAEEILAAIDFEPAPNGPGHAQWTPRGEFPSFGYGIAPEFRQSLFDPDDPFRYQVLLRLNLGIALTRGLSLNTSVGINLINNFDEIARTSDSQLPRVRSDFAEYLRQGETGIDTLALNYTFRLGEQTFARARAGILEEMFSGVGGEVLYRPFNRRWAVGANLFAVQQRAFDKLLGLRDYRTLTGHASVYYELPYHDLSLAVHAGRYLARDYGATFELSRRFDTGVEIGAFATFTDVPFDEFGEGSFDKGLTVRIPFGWFTPFATKRTYGIDLRPLTRDGGQRLNGSTTLYRATLDETPHEIERNWEGFTE